MDNKPGMSKTAALKAAQAACGRIHRRSSTDYVCYVPFYDDRPDGPSTELQASDFWRCRAARARRVAAVALALMGYSTRAGGEADFALEEVFYRNLETSAKGIVDRVLRRLKKEAT